MNAPSWAVSCSTVALSMSTGTGSSLRALGKPPTLASSPTSSPYTRQGSSRTP
uniref:Uncharacterized protein n=1 Tax=uncultured marine virus TaxID=186617 RepID=A0A0F7L3W6_9VIRU|nr:hypothetical protein [uncultured marine virus]